MASLACHLALDTLCLHLLKLELQMDLHTHSMGSEIQIWDFMFE